MYKRQILHAQGLLAILTIMGSSISLFINGTDQAVHFDKSIIMSSFIIIYSLYASCNDMDLFNLVRRQSLVEVCTVGCVSLEKLRVSKWLVKGSIAIQKSLCRFDGAVL